MLPRIGDDVGHPRFRPAFVNRRVAAAARLGADIHPAARGRWSGRRRSGGRIVARLRGGARRRVLAHRERGPEYDCGGGDRKVSGVSHVHRTMRQPEPYRSSEHLTRSAGPFHVAVRPLDLELGWPRHTWDPILLGFLLMGAALVLRRWLSKGADGERAGFTPDEAPARAKLDSINEREAASMQRHVTSIAVAFLVTVSI